MLGVAPVGSGGGVSPCPGVTKIAPEVTKPRDYFCAEISSSAWPSVCPPLPETLTQLVSFSDSPCGASLTLGSQKGKDLFATKQIRV